MKIQKMVLLIVLISFAQRGLGDNGAAVAPAATPGAAEICKSQQEALTKEAETLTVQDQLRDGDLGSNSMKECVALSRGHMRELYKNSNSNTPIAWDNYAKHSAKCIPKLCNNDEYTKCVRDELSVAARCDAAAYLISSFERDWTNPEHMKTDTVKGGNPQITCQGTGIETLDYEGCVKFVQNGDLADAAQAVAQKGQELVYADKAMDAQTKAANSKNTATSGLEAMKSGAEDQQEMLTQRAALDAGKFAYLGTIYSDIPESGSLTVRCQKYESIVPSALKDMEGCKKAILPQFKFDFLRNDAAKEKMKEKLASVGISAVSNTAMASLMNKRAGEINNAIANVNSFKPIDPLAPNMDNVQTTYCQQNPGDPKCLTGGLNRVFDATSDNVISFGPGGTGVSFNNPDPTPNGTGTTTNSNPTNPTNTHVGGVGSAINPVDQKGGLVDTLAAAAISHGGAAPAGGGGGGGGSSGGGGGGGGGAPAGGQPQGGVSAAIQGKTPNYGGGSGTLSMMGGLGINKAKANAKDDGNPFGKLLGKEESKSGVLNLPAGRSPASVGNKSDNLFDIISKRYGSVSNDKRLLEYELTK